ncbi:MAG: hypothetical protein ACPGUD_09555 [Parashewanella sp.]
MSLKIIGVTSPISFKKPSLEQVAKANDLHSATRVTGFDKIKDMFAGNKREKAMKALYFLTNEKYLAANEPDKAVRQAEAFRTLEQLADPASKQQFHAEVTHVQGHEFEFRYKIDQVVSDNNRDDGYCTIQLGNDSLLRKEANLAEAIDGFNQFQYQNQGYHSSSGYQTRENENIATAMFNDVKERNSDYAHNLMQVASLKPFSMNRNYKEPWVSQWNEAMNDIGLATVNRHKQAGRIYWGYKNLNTAVPLPTNLQLRRPPAQIARGYPSRQYARSSGGNYRPQQPRQLPPQALLATDDELGLNRIASALEGMFSGLLRWLDIEPRHQSLAPVMPQMSAIQLSAHQTEVLAGYPRTQLPPPPYFQTPNYGARQPTYFYEGRY